MSFNPVEYQLIYYSVFMHQLIRNTKPSPGAYCRPFNDLIYNINDSVWQRIESK